MALAEPALRLEPHVHSLSETCPTCDQPIPNEKAKEIRERAAAMEKRLADAADARAAAKIAEEKAQIEGAAQAKVDQAEREKAEAVEKANAEAATKIEAARTEGQKVAEASFVSRVAAAEQSRTDAEKARADAETVAAQKIEAAQEAQKQLEAANDKVQQVEAERDAVVEGARSRSPRSVRQGQGASACQEGLGE